MKITPYASGRFQSLLKDKSSDFKKLIYQCQVNTCYVDKGSDILLQGQKLEYIYIVPVGCVSVSIIETNGRCFQLGKINCDYHIFGEMEFFTKTHCQWTIIADEPLQVDTICITALTQALYLDPRMMFFFASALAADYQDSMAIYTHRLLHPIAYNIAHDLLMRQETTAELENFDKVSQEAERFGTSGRVYRRAVKDLMNKGLIKKTKLGLEIVDVHVLRSFLDSYE